MRLPQRFVTLLTNTIQPVNQSLKSTIQRLTDRQHGSASSTETEIDRDDVQNTGLIGTSTPIADGPQDTIVIAVIGQRHIGKTSLLQYGLNNTTPPSPLEPSVSPLGGVDVKSIPNIGQHSIMLELNNQTKLRHVMFLEIDHDPQTPILLLLLPQENDITTTTADAALICYDVTQLQSMAGIPDLLDLYHSHHQLPVLLLGLKSDLASCRQVDSTLGEQLAQKHSVPFYEMKTTNALDIQQVLMKLVRQCMKSATDTIKKGGTDTDKIGLGKHDDPQTTLVISDSSDSITGTTLTGFTYAPTPSHSTCHQYDSPPRHTKSTSSSLRKISTENFSNHRRGSKDSCDSFGTGLTVDDIIDRLVSPEMGRCDEQMVPIFIIFFRKFMTPTELVKALAKRFENDLCAPEQSTLLQKRIILVLTTWITSYWSDFYHQRTRDQLDHFVGYLSNLKRSAITTESSMQGITDTLLRLSVQHPPDYDIDECWGRKDKSASELNYSKKKDSGFISSYFGASNNTSHTMDFATKDRSFDSNTWSKRLSYAEDDTPTFTDSISPSSQRSSIIPTSNSINFGVRTTSFKKHITSPATSFSLSRSTSTTYSPSISSVTGPFTPSSSTYTKSPHHTLPHRTSSSIRQSRTLFNFNNKQGMKRSDTSASFLSRTTSLNQPEFAGGTITIDIWKPPQSKLPSISLSPTDESTTSASKSSTRDINRHQTPPSLSSPLHSYSLYAKSYVSKLSNTDHPKHRCHRRSEQIINSVRAGSFPTTLSPDKRKGGKSNSAQFTSRDSTSTKSNTKLLLLASDQEMAEQLTWIEAELFENIESREFVRMVWANNHTKQQQRTRHSSVTSIPAEEQHDQQSSACMKKSGLVASISHFNFVSALVISMVVMQPKLSKRVALLEKWMKIAVALRNLNNYNTLMAILAGINNAALSRLRRTQERIKKKRIFKQFQSLEKLMSSDKSYSSYRMALKASASCPSIPYLGIHSQDLIALAEANKDIRTDGTIHWEKFRLMGECITTTINFQQPKHEISPNPMILSWMANYHILTEEEQYLRSTKAEPRLKSTRINSFRDIWMRV